MGWGLRVSCPDCRHEWEGVETTFRFGLWSTIEMSQLSISSSRFDAYDIRGIWSDGTNVWAVGAGGVITRGAELSGPPGLLGMIGSDLLAVTCAAVTRTGGGAATPPRFTNQPGPITIDRCANLGNVHPNASYNRICRGVFEM